MKLALVCETFPMKLYVNILLLLFTMCSAFGQQYLIPDAYDREIDLNKIAIIDNHDQVVFIENMEWNAAAVVFDVEIRNFSLDKLEVAPTEMIMMVSRESFPLVAESGSASVTQFENNLKRHHALHQRDAANNYRKIIRTRKALGIALTALAVGLATYDAAKDTQDWQSSIWTEAMTRQSITRDFVTMVGFVSTDVAKGIIEKANVRQTEDLQYIDQEILEYTSVKPMEAVRGKVFFPGAKGKYYRVIIPLAGNEYVIDFRKPTSRESKHLNSPGR